ncbi:MAG: hypothetical protein V2I45_07515 [Halieaceae bacterium]|jgi:hypothetical protein|nr:hypothetical protein [Halieaceae bacterium]
MTAINWDAISTITEVVGTLAILITLIYLSRQVHAGNRQAELEGMRYTLNGFNDYMNLVVQSKETANVLRRGRANIDSLDEDEYIQFECLHLHLLNTMEGWCRSVEETARDDTYRRTQEENMEAVVAAWFMNSGAREMWAQYRDAFPLLISTFDAALAKHDGTQSGQPAL